MRPQDNIELIQNLDNDLAICWQVMRKFCSLVNLATQIERFVYPDFIHQTMTTVIYRLLHMGFAIGSVNETVRLGLLAFSHHVFLQWQDIRPPHCYFPAVYKTCILGLGLVDGLSSQLVLWLLMTGATSLFSISDEAWLRKCLREGADRCQVKTWKEMLKILNSFMWIATLDEQPGKQIYDLLYLEGQRLR